MNQVDVLEVGEVVKLFEEVLQEHWHKYNYIDATIPHIKVNYGKTIMIFSFLDAEEYGGIYVKCTLKDAKTHKEYGWFHQLVQGINVSEQKLLSKFLTKLEHRAARHNSGKIKKRGGING